MREPRRRKLRVAIIGTGNIGTDLMMKVERSPSLELVGMAGIDPDSAGLRKARERGHHRHRTTGWQACSSWSTTSTSRSTRPRPARTPSTRGCWPRAASAASTSRRPRSARPSSRRSTCGSTRDAREVNLITCGAQATIPIVAAVSAVADVAYAETVSTVSSRSAGPGTRQNIDEFTTSTARGLETVGGAREAKAIIILNPADPPIMMRNTIYAEVADPDRRGDRGARSPQRSRTSPPTCPATA